MDQGTRKPLPFSRRTRPLWRTYADRGMVAAAFLVIVWAMFAGSLASPRQGLATASVDSLKATDPVSAAAR